MKCFKLTGSLVIAVIVTMAGAAQAESLVDGVYKSQGDAKGTGKCTLVIKSIEEAHKYGDEAFELESSGEGSCEWSAIGMSKNFAITGGMVTGGGAPAFVKLTFPFGPAGKQVEMTSFDLDGTVRNKELFARSPEGDLSTIAP